MELTLPPEHELGPSFVPGSVVTFEDLAEIILAEIRNARLITKTEVSSATPDGWVEAPNASEQLGKLIADFVDRN